MKKLVDEQYIAWLSWLWLTVLTLLSLTVDTLIEQPIAWLAIVFAIVFLKGQQIVDVFMELRGAPTRWRLLLLAYVLILPAVLFTIYIL